MLKSFRVRKTEELICWGKEAASVFADVQENDHVTNLGVSISPQGRRAFINQSKIESVGEFLRKLISVVFSPRDLALVKGGPQERRKFVDKHLVDLSISYFDDLLSYQKALKNKNAILKEGKASDKLLDAWDQVLAPLVVRISERRQAFVDELEDAAKTIYQSFSVEDGKIQLKLDALRGRREQNQCDIEGILKVFRHQRKKEILARTSLFGPHLDEIKISINGHDARSFASQGQARSIVLALKLAVIRIIERKLSVVPIVLLDDVDSELDQVRSNAFFDMLLREERQVFITGTELAFTRSSVKKKVVNSMLIENGALICQ